MNEYAILIGLTTYVDLGEDQDRDKSRRLWAIHNLIFSLGPAWHGNQGSVLLKTALSREEIVDRIVPLVGMSDIVVVLEIDAKSITTIGWTADEEGLEALYSGVLKVDSKLID